MKKLIIAVCMVGGLLSGPVLAKDVTVKISNITNGVYFTPLLLAMHQPEAGLFELGETASASLQAMAEGGDISGLAIDMAAIGAHVVTNPAAGLLAPGHATTAHFKTSAENAYLSLAGMLLPTNDGFVGLDSLQLPKKSGSYTFYLNGYDAGTEANDEIINGAGAPGMPGIPADPGMHNGTGASGVTSHEANKRVHIHRGVIGDMDVAGGKSDLDSRVHHWQNPVAKLVIVINDEIE